MTPRLAVAEAAAKTEDAGSSRIAVEARVASPNARGGLTITGEGEVDYDRRVARLTYDMERVGAVDVVVDGFVYYLRLPAAADELPVGAEWVKLDLEAAGFAGELGEIAQLGQADPSRMLLYLRGASSGIRRLGTDEVRGVETTHYQGDVDLERAVERSLDRVPEGRRAQVRLAIQALVAAMGRPTVPVDVWIDDDGRARRLAMSLKLAGSGRESVRMSVTIDLFDFGVDVDARPPPAEDVVDMQELLGL